MKSLLSLLFILTSLSGCGAYSTGSGTTDGAASQGGQHDSENVAGSSSSDSPDETPTGQDPLIQNTVFVTFDISVPAYQSNELQVTLIWGNTQINAMWMGDEYWSVTADLPTDKQNLLTVTFYDQNGSMELARFSQNFRTSSNPEESFQISADMFNTDHFDSDEDGTNNLDEMIAGTDPFVDETTLLEVQDYVRLYDILSYTQQFEISLPAERPYSFSTSEIVPFSVEEDSLGTTYYTNVDIDKNGNGTHSNGVYSVYYRESQSGIRTNSGTSVLWEGTLSSYDGDYSRYTTFTNTVRKVDENTRQFIEAISQDYSGYYRDTFEISSNVIGKIIEGTSYCKPVSGTVVRTSGTNRSSQSYRNNTLTVSKEFDDRYWKVVFVNGDNETREYLARELQIYQDLDQRYGNLATFKCVFVDM